MAGRLQDRVAIVTGSGSVGPGWGNGRATAVLFAREGASVFCVDRSAPAMAETARHIRDHGGRFELHECDVTDNAGVAAMVAACCRVFGRIDVLVNNVGGSAAGGHGGTVVVEVELGFPAGRYGAELGAELQRRLAAAPGVGPARAEVTWQVAAQAVHGGIDPLPGIRNVVAVASGKGGVGKSTTAVNLAIALALEGARVGLLDADIYGPSQPRMTGLQGVRPSSRDGRRLEPLEAHGLRVMSIGFLIEEEQPMVWRGPMVTQALQQLLNDTDWGELDYLIVDMPPGTGDIQLTLSQRVPVSGAVVVTTPEDIALLDARKGLRMFQKVNVPVLGIVENMSTHVCSKCGHEEPVFGSGGGARMAEQYGVSLLASLPLASARRSAVGFEIHEHVVIVPVTEEHLAAIP